MSSCCISSAGNEISSCFLLMSLLSSGCNFCRIDIYFLRTCSPWTARVFDLSKITRVKVWGILKALIMTEYLSNIQISALSTICRSLRASMVHWLQRVSVSLFSDEKRLESACLLVSFSMHPPRECNPLAFCEDCRDNIWEYICSDNCKIMVLFVQKKV